MPNPEGKSCPLKCVRIEKPLDWAAFLQVSLYAIACADLAIHLFPANYSGYTPGTPRFAVGASHLMKGI